MESSSSEQPTGSIEDVLRLIMASISLLYTLWMIWILMPDHTKRLLAMRLSRAIQKAASSTASRTGTLALQEEARCGVHNYLLPYGLSLLREHAAAIYETLRYTA